MCSAQGRSGDFLGCSKFPKCRGTRCDADGREVPEGRRRHLRAAQSKARGKLFYGCENYPTCDFVVWDKPVPRRLPGVRLRGRGGEAEQDARRLPECLKCQNEWDVAGETAEVEEPVAV